jgi:hypothetical protein
MDIGEALAPLPLLLRRRILFLVDRRVAELKLENQDEARINKEIVETVLQELYFSTILPIEMAQTILKTDLADISKGFKVEFSDLPIDAKFLSETNGLVKGFHELTDKLGFERSDLIGRESNNKSWRKRSRLE